MGSDVLVKVEGVSKKFCRDLKRSLWYGVKDTAADLIGRNGTHVLRPSEFWAVEDISLELARGECLGLIGRNGAGKTTLLKMLNGLFKPDHGRIELTGRIGALISLGAGFNPILTGRENIYVNGAVLGLTTQEIDQKFDAIVDFAEVRLGFAVATAMQPDVLLLDEVLAVGDVAFRAKCYERLARIRDRAAFILVSHDTDQIARVCSKVLVLDRGRTHHLGDVGEGIRIYHELSRPRDHTSSYEQSAEGTIAAIGRCDDTVADGGLFSFSISLDLPAPVTVADVRVVFWGDDGLPALDAYTRTQGWSLRLEEGISVVSLAVGPLRLKRGRYTVSIALLDRSNNLHLYWGDRIRAVEVDGPITGAVPYTPPLTCLSITAENGRLESNRGSDVG
jgi:lipopolysaccharide transport system ATP-binding protein